MITPQNIREKTFEKTVFSGYDMGPVDDFLETLADEIGTLQKENAALKAKMKVLVDKIEEYRSNEAALNAAILSAQKLSVQIESDARVRAASIISEAENKAAATISSIDERIAVEESRLQAAKISTAKFFDNVRELCKKQISSLDTISVAARDTLGADKSADDALRIPAVDQSAADHTQVFKFSKEG